MCQQKLAFAGIHPHSGVECSKCDLNSFSDFAKVSRIVAPVRLNDATAILNGPPPPPNPCRSARCSVVSIKTFDSMMYDGCWR